MFALLAIPLLIIVLILLMLPVWMRDASPIPMGLEADENQKLIDLEIEKQILLNSLTDPDHDLPLEVVRVCLKALFKTGHHLKRIGHALRVRGGPAARDPLLRLQTDSSVYERVNTRGASQNKNAQDD